MSLIAKATTNIPRILSWRSLIHHTIHWTAGSLLSLSLSVPDTARARPRPPMPPAPELSGRLLYRETFDWAWTLGLSGQSWVLPPWGVLCASWSGLALQRTGVVPPFLVPGVEASGQTNVASQGPGALRFWFTPGWASRSAGGSGPGRWVVLAELVAADIEQWGLVLGLEHAVGNKDSYGYEHGQNMYGYKPREEDRDPPWGLLPYDVELGLGTPNVSISATNPVFDHFSDDVLQRLWTTNAFRRAYWRGFWALVNPVNGPMRPSKCCQWPMPPIKPCWPTTCPSRAMAP